MKQRIAAILEHWFIQEPALFQILCTHEFAENYDMPCPVRSGRRKVEYNPRFLQEMTDLGLEEALRTEAVRILLKHPYERKPDGCSGQAVALGSNLVIGDNYSHAAFRIEKPADYELPAGKTYEWYARKVQEMFPDGPDGADGPNGAGGASSGGEARNQALSELWEEDELTLALINGVIEGCQSWGSLAGAFAEQIKASTKARIDWRNVFGGFRASILSSKRKLTRMRPNRRTGFQNLGSIRRFDTRLLVAVDVSGSISSESLSYFYGVVNSAFRYGFECIDVIQFDCGIRVVQNLKKVIRELVAVGRGGTSFQEPIDYAMENGYDGLVMLTDGYAPEPCVPDSFRGRIVWVCQDRTCYEHNHHWMEKKGRVCVIEL